VRVRVADEIVEVDPIGLQQLVDEREGEETIRAGPDTDPLVGDRTVARAHRIDDDDLRSALLELAQAQLDGIGVMVLRHAPQHQILCMLPVRLAELPERPAERVQPARCHVHGAEAAVRRVVDRAELLRPPASQRLRLVAAGEEGELVGIARADCGEPVGRQRHGLVPLDLTELARAALADAQERLVQPCRGVVLHDSRRALRAQHAAIDRVRGITLDVADAAVAQPDLDAATAGAHVAGGRPDVVARRRRVVDGGLCRE
jgi:hypothetical protein